VVVQGQKDRISIQINLYVDQYLESSDLHARNAELELGIFAENASLRPIRPLRSG
jgi:hypothetical protein